jgi:hypothetical protein
MVGATVAGGDDVVPVGDGVEDTGGWVCASVPPSGKAFVSTNTPRTTAAITSPALRTAVVTEM